MNPIKPGKLIRTNKDLVFWTVWTIWVVTNIVISKHVVITNLVFIVLFVILILLKSYNTKFADWLRKER